MAKLSISAELIIQALKLGTVSIDGASFDGRCVVFEISGPEVPQVNEVVAEFTLQRERIDVRYIDASGAAT